MKKGILEVIVCMLMITAAVLPAAGIIENTEINENVLSEKQYEPYETTHSNNFEMLIDPTVNSRSETIEIGIDSTDSSELSALSEDNVYHIYEGLHWKLFVTAYWVPPQEKQICLWAGTLPYGATFYPPCNCGIGSVTSTLEWTPAIGQAGTYTITFYIGESCYNPVGSSQITVVVHKYTPDPQYEYTIPAGQEWSLRVTARWVPPQPTRPICLWIDTGSLPYGATFPPCHCDYGEVTSTLVWTPTDGQICNEFIITFFAGEYCGYYTFPFSIKVKVTDPTEEEIIFNQIDWFGTEAPLIKNSEWGECTIEISPSETVTYLNVIAKIKESTQWIIRNVIVLPSSIDPYFKSTTQLFDLSSLGIARGEDVSIIDYYLDIGPIALTSPPIGQLRPAKVGTITYDTIGGKDGTPTDPGTPTEPPSYEQVCDINYNFRVLFPNVDLASANDRNGCGPAAQANSLKWLSDTYDEIDIKDNLRTIYEDVNDAIGRKPGKTINDSAFLEGKLKYIQEKNLPIVVKFMDDGWGGKNFETDNGTAYAKGTIPTFEFIKQEFEAGQDVELGFTYIDPKRGGHWVTVTGWFSICGKVQGVWVADDGCQTIKGGLRDRMCVLSERPDGFLEISNFARNYVDIVVSESPHNPPNKPETPTGPRRVKPGEEVTYETSPATHPDGYKIQSYEWDFDGDGVVDKVTNETSVSHSWPSQGDKQVRVRARDEYGAVSEWSDPLPVKVPKNKAYINTLLLFFRFFENHPHLFPLLRFLINLPAFK